MTDHDPINHPRHYTAYNGLEIIDLTEQLNFNRGNAVKYISRAGLKDPATELEDLAKAHWYIERELARVEKEQAKYSGTQEAEPEDNQDIEASLAELRAKLTEPSAPLPIHNF